MWLDCVDSGGPACAGVAWGMYSRAIPSWTAHSYWQHLQVTIFAWELQVLSQLQCNHLVQDSSKELDKQKVISFFLHGFRCCISWFSESASRSKAVVCTKGGSPHCGPIAKVAWWEPEIPKSAFLGAKTHTEVSSCFASHTNLPFWFKNKIMCLHGCQNTCLRVNSGAKTVQKFLKSILLGVRFCA